MKKQNKGLQTLPDKRGKIKQCNPDRSFPCGKACLSINSDILGRCQKNLIKTSHNQALKLLVNLKVNNNNKINIGQEKEIAKLDLPSEKFINKNELNKRIESLVNALNEISGNGEELLSRIESNAQRMLNETEIHIGIPSISIIEKIIKQGRLKNQYETKKGGFTSKDGLKFRKDIENKQFGIAEDADPKDRPIYGYPARKGQHGEMDNPGVTCYGNYHIRLKSNVKERSTFTLKDSLNYTKVDLATGKATPEFQASSINNVSAASLLTSAPDYFKPEYWTKEEYRKEGIDNVAAKANSISNANNFSTYNRSNDIRYQEIQVHGGVKVEDFDAIIVPEGTKISDTLLKASKKYGFTIEY